MTSPDDLKAHKNVILPKFKPSKSLKIHYISGKSSKIFEIDAPHSLKSDHPMCSVLKFLVN